MPRIFLGYYALHILQSSSSSSSSCLRHRRYLELGCACGSAPPLLSARPGACARVAWYSRAGAIQKLGKKRRESPLERAVQSEKAYARVRALQRTLLRIPERVASTEELGRLRYKSVSPSSSGKGGPYRRQQRFSNLVRKYPGVFELFRDEDRVTWCGLTASADALATQESALRQAYEPLAVAKVRKLLMMSLDRCLYVSKLNHLKADFGLPHDFRTRMIYAYPEFFCVTERNGNTMLELASWDPALAVSVVQDQAKREALEWNATEEQPRFAISKPRWITLSRSEKVRIEKFQQLPYISPYAGIDGLQYNTPELEKRNVAVLHEILSLTLEKRTSYDNLTHFHKDIKLPQSILPLLLKHFGIFYVPSKGNRLSVFLKEAYDGMHLIEKNEWVILKEKLLDLMAKCGNTFGKFENEMSDLYKSNDDAESDESEDWKEGDYEGSDAYDSHDDDNDGNSYDF